MFQLEYDHIHPLALGGESTVANTTLHCKPHNLDAARDIFGDALMSRYTRRARPSERESASVGDAPSSIIQPPSSA